jgi:hypothetical protein
MLMKVKPLSSNPNIGEQQVRPSWTVKVDVYGPPSSAGMPSVSNQVRLAA